MGLIVTEANQNQDALASLRILPPLLRLSNKTLHFSAKQS